MLERFALGTADGSVSREHGRRFVEAHATRLSWSDAHLERMSRRVARLMTAEEAIEFVAADVRTQPPRFAEAFPSRDSGCDRGVAPPRPLIHAHAPCAILAHGGGGGGAQRSTVPSPHRRADRPTDRPSARQTDRRGFLARVAGLGGVAGALALDPAALRRAAERATAPAAPRGQAGRQPSLNAPLIAREPSLNHLAWVWQFSQDGSKEEMRGVLAEHGLGVALKTHDGTDWMARYDPSRTPLTAPGGWRNSPPSSNRAGCRSTPGPSFTASTRWARHATPPRCWRPAPAASRSTWSRTPGSGVARRKPRPSSDASCGASSRRRGWWPPSTRARGRWTASRWASSRASPVRSRRRSTGAPSRRRRTCASSRRPATPSATMA